MQILIFTFPHLYFLIHSMKDGKIKLYYVQWENSSVSWHLFNKNLRTSFYAFIHSFHLGWGHRLCCFLSEQFSEKVQHLLPADFTSGWNGGKKKMELIENLTSLVEFENGAVRQESQLGQKPCKTSSLIGWHSELEDQQLWKQIQSGYKADFSFISINYHTHQKLLLRKFSNEYL